MSVLTQQEVELEVVITDDSRSSVISDFVALIKPSYPNVRYVAGARTGNPVENWNHGLDAARGRYCILVHHDEFLVDPLFLRDAVALLDGGKDVVVGKCAVIGIAKESKIALVSRLAALFRPPLWMLYAVNWMGPTASMVYANSPDRRFDLGLAYVVDVDFLVRLLSGAAVARIPRVVVGSVGHHAEQITAKMDVAAVHRRELIEMERLGRLTRFQRRGMQVLLSLKYRLAGPR